MTLDASNPEEGQGRPRDSRVEAFLRQAEGILSAQRQWSAQTQIKLKALAKEVKLPPELFEVAMEIMADPTRQTPPTRWEQAFVEYLERQFARLPGEILSLPQERKALQYGQRKFQLSPDACERCLARVAAQWKIARISDSQAVAFAQTEVARLVSKSTLSADQLQTQVCQLAERWGVEPRQATRLLVAELNSKRAKRRRRWLRSVSFVGGVLALSLLLIAAIVLLGRVLSPSTAPRLEVVQSQSDDSRIEGVPDARLAVSENRLPVWWTPRQVELLERIDQEGHSPKWLQQLADSDWRNRAAAYEQLWEWLAQRDERLIAAKMDQPLWLRQPLVQEALLHWFWREPEEAATVGWATGLHRLRGRARIVMPTALSQSPRAKVAVAGTQLLGDLLIASAADNILLRVLQKSELPNEAIISPPAANRRMTQLSRGHLTVPVPIQSGLEEKWVESLRQRWFAENMEQIYSRLQGLWPELPRLEVSEATETTEPAVVRQAWMASIAAVAEMVRLIPDPDRRARMVVLWWSGIAGVEPVVAGAAWNEVEVAMSQIPAEHWEPLLESWTVVPLDSEWHLKLRPRWSAIAAENQKTLTGDPLPDMILLQRLLRIVVLPSTFQLERRRRLVQEELQRLEPTIATKLAPTTMAPWQTLAKGGTLATLVATDLPLAEFDRQWLAIDFAASAERAQPGLFEAFADGDAVARNLETLRQVADLETYQLGVNRLASLLEDVPLVSPADAEQWITFLRQVQKPEERAAWLVTFEPITANRSGSPSVTFQAAARETRLLPRAAPSAPSSNQVGPTTALQRIADDPVMFLALIDAWERAPETLPLDLHWLGWQTWLEGILWTQADIANLGAQPEVFAQLRQIAWERLRNWDQRHQVSQRSRLTALYEFVLAAREPSERRDPPEDRVMSGEPDPLISILLQHERWVERLCLTLARDPQSWLAEHRQAVDREVNTRQALWVAEKRALQLLTESLQSRRQP